MSFFRRVKDATSDLASASKRRAKRGKLEVDVRRLESKISAEKNAIGHAIFPLLQSAAVQVELPEVEERMRTVAELLNQIGAKKAELDHLSAPQDDDDTIVESIRNVDTNAKVETSVKQSVKDEVAKQADNPAEQGGEG
ncbi:MAG: hypothetical protein ABI939_05920 [Anaerolineaceae bacterium]